MADKMTDDNICTLEFKNPQATPKEVRMRVSVRDIPLIVQWYGAFHEGDTYTVWVNNGTDALPDEEHLQTAMSQIPLRIYEMTGGEWEPSMAQTREIMETTLEALKKKGTT